MITPVYNRTAADVTRAANLLLKIRADGFDSLTPEEQAVWVSGMKALENYTDWNRQNANISTGGDVVRSLGYSAPVSSMPVATMEDVPALEDVNKLEGNLSAIESCGLTMPVGWESSKMWAPGTGPAFADWNRWERNMVLLEEMAARISAAWYYSGDLYSGEV